MKPARFQYVDPRTVGEAVAFIAAHPDDAKVLAGGQSLMPVINMRLARPAFVVDLKRIDDLDYIAAGNGGLRIGAMTTQRALLDSPDVAARCPLITTAVPWIGHAAIRQRGTLGGSLVHADPSAELPAVVAALDAELVLRGPGGERTVSAREFFVSFFTTVAAPDELLVEVRVPAAPQGTRVATVELARRKGDFALAGIVASVGATSDDAVTAPRLCAFGVDEVPRRLEACERLLDGQTPDHDLLRELEATASGEVEPESDMHASAEYRRQMTGVLARRALSDALAHSTSDTQTKGE
jgi:aerobic carbon-monoxide dehydrogenase medium subunit